MIDVAIAAAIAALVIAVVILMIWFMWSNSNGVGNSAPFLCQMGFHRWDSKRDISIPYPMRIAGTGFTYEYTCSRCGKTTIGHEGGFC